MAENKKFLNSTFNSFGSSYIDNKVREILNAKKEEEAKRKARGLDTPQDTHHDLKAQAISTQSSATKSEATPAIYPNSTPGIFKEDDKYEAPRFGHSLILSQSNKFKAFTDAVSIQKQEEQEKNHHVVDLFLKNIAATHLSNHEKNKLCKKLVSIRETVDKYTNIHHTHENEDTTLLSDITMTNATVALEIKTLLDTTLPNLNRSFFNLSFAGILNERHYEQLSSALDDISSFLEFLDNNATEELNDEFAKAIIYTQKHYKMK